MMAARSNLEWLECLSGKQNCQDAALHDLRAALEKAARFYIQRHLYASSAGLAKADEGAALAEDIAQDATVLVLSKLDTYRGEARFLTWACSFAMRLTRTALQRRLWRNVSLERAPDGWREPATVLLSAGGWDNPQDALQRAAIWEVIREVIERELTEHQRMTLDLVVIQGLSTEQVEELLHVSASALYKTTHDARRKLKAGLLKRGYTTGEILRAFAAEG
jgi:RNA polymerase sigma-70 factor (ECF subfamily)